MFTLIIILLVLLILISIGVLVRYFPELFKKFKIFILSVSILGVVAFSYFWYLYNKPVDKTGDVKTELSVNATLIFSDFENDEVAANSKYLGKVIEVEGVMRETTSDELGSNLVLESGNDFFGINCAMEKGQEENLSKLTPGSKVIVKGSCAGFNGDVVLVGCIIVSE